MTKKSRREPMIRKCVNCFEEILENHEFYQIEAVSYDHRTRCRTLTTGKVVVDRQPITPYRATGALSFCIICYTRYLHRYLSKHMEFLGGGPFE